MSAAPAAVPERVGILGAGTMGAGIALSFALAGSSVRVCGRRGDKRANEGCAAEDDERGLSHSQFDVITK